MSKDRHFYSFSFMKEITNKKTAGFRCNFIWRIERREILRNTNCKKNRMFFCLASFSVLTTNIVVCNRLVLYLFIPSKNREFHFIALILLHDDCLK